MPGLIEFRRDKYGESYAIYPQRPLDLPEKTKTVGKLVMVASVTTLIAAFVGFYSYSLYTYVMGDWVLRSDVTKDLCTFQLITFITPLIPLAFALMIIMLTYRNCFLTQVVACKTKSSFTNFIFIPPFMFPLMFIWLPSCAIPPISFKPVFLGLCLLCAIMIAAHLHYLKKHCQCKRCLGIKDVKLQYGSQHKLIDERATLNLAILANWFSIDLSRNSQLAIELENSEIIHTFTRDSSNIQLMPGNYYICVMQMVPMTIRPEPIDVKRICEPAPMPSSHLIAQEDGPIQHDETIMNID